jgi:hypothetical protein
MDLEGIVSKRLDAPYRSDRSETWTKSKCRAGHEVVIGGYTTTNSAFRSLIAASIAATSWSMSAGSARASARQGPRMLPRLEKLATDKSPSPAPVRRRRKPRSPGPDPNWSPRSNSPASPATAWCARRLQGAARRQAGRRCRGRDARAGEERRARRTGAGRKRPGPRPGLDRGHGRRSPTPARLCGPTPTTVRRSPSWTSPNITRRSVPG